MPAKQGMLVTEESEAFKLGEAVGKLIFSSAKARKKKKKTKRRKKNHKNWNLFLKILTLAIMAGGFIHSIFASTLLSEAQKYFAVSFLFIFGVVVYVRFIVEPKIK